MLSIGNLFEGKFRWLGFESTWDQLRGSWISLRGIIANITDDIDRLNKVRIDEIDSLLNFLSKEKNFELTLDPNDKNFLRSSGIQWRGAITGPMLYKVILDDKLFLKTVKNPEILFEKLTEWPNQLKNIKTMEDVIEVVKLYKDRSDKLITSSIKQFPENDKEIQYGFLNDAIGFCHIIKFAVMRFS